MTADTIRHIFEALTQTGLALGLVVIFATWVDE